MSSDDESAAGSPLTNDEYDDDAAFEDSDEDEEDRLRIDAPSSRSKSKAGAGSDEDDDELASDDEDIETETIPVEVSLGCLDLPPFELTGSCMSVFAVLWLYRRKDNRWQEHGRTEVVRHGDSPGFVRSFFLNYIKNENPITFAKTDQWLRVDLYQRGSTLPNLSSHIKQGEVKFTLRELFRTPIKRISRELVRDGKRS
eukprot:SAG22_NODE_3958_length_1450_cov_1.106588_1_plen_198_part_10